MMKLIEAEYFGHKVSLETGRIAKQADGAVMVNYGDTQVLVTAVASKEANEGADFFPLTCLYQVKAYGRGKIPGGFFKREAKLSDFETLVSRMIDRPIRPLFEEGFQAETQVIATVMSQDPECDSVAAAILGASASLYISDIPYHTPVAGVTVGLIDGEFIVNPTAEQAEVSEMQLLLVAREDAIVMVEAEAKQVDEETMLKALDFGHKAVLPLIELQKQLKEEVGKAKREVAVKAVDESLKEAVVKAGFDKMKTALEIPTKMERYEACSQVKDEVVEELVTEESEWEAADVKSLVGSLKKDIMRENILSEGVRVDGRDLTTVRPIKCEIGVLSKAHGSALFTRGETQAIVVTTLGTKDDEQMIDDPTGLYFKRFFLHYNFPPYSVGEVKRMGPPGRREIGHGKLAERGLVSTLPEQEKFPYTIRVVSEITESNGSSSMASVCGGSLSLMDAGVPVEEAVAGIAMGLISDGDRYAVLTDILGDEDHVGDMDFKVVGTKKGITALQMDIKIDGLKRETMEQALRQAHEGRLHILGEMAKAMDVPREKLSNNAPRFIQIKVATDKIREIIGPGGRMIKSIQSESGARVEINDTGVINISSSDQESAEKAVAMIQGLIKEVEVGKIYEGTVKKITDFGAFVECLPGKDGLVHISEISEERVKNVSDVLTEGQTVKVKAVSFDRQGKLKLTMKGVEQ